MPIFLMLTIYMKSTLDYFRQSLIPILGLLLLSACNHKELDDTPKPNFRVKVDFDWHKTSTKGEAEAEMMQVFFYNRSTGDLVYDIFPAKEGGYMNLEPGEWQVTTNSYNEGTNIIGDHIGSFSDHHLTTRAGNILEGALGNTLDPTLDGEQPVYVTPDMVWGEARELVMIDPLPGQREFVVTLEPEELVCHYSFEIRNVENLSHITNMCGALSGMSGGMTFSSYDVDAESVTLPLSAEADGSKTIRGEFYTFGFHPQNQDPKMMSLYVWLDDGRKLVFGTTEDAKEKWNVSDQIINAENPKRVHYIIDGLSIPESMDGGLFNPSADDWTSEDHEIGL